MKIQFQEVIIIKRKYLIGIILAFLVGLAFLIYFIFFRYVSYTLSDKTLRGPDGTYMYVSMADQTTTKLHNFATGRTTDGDLVFELEDDADHQYLVVVPDTEMPIWELYRRK